MGMKWDSRGYDEGFSFVSRYGEALLDLVGAGPGASCLDLGCGTGTLAGKLAARGLSVVGMDSSPEQLARARETHPDIEFVLADATDFSLDEPVDVVFSNAVLHWIDRDDQPRALACVARALRPGGELVFEMGGAGNNALTHRALAEAFARHGLPYEVPFYFPTIGEYASLLEGAGLTPTFATLFERPTPLAGGADGMARWIRMFPRRPFVGVPDELASRIVDEAVEALEPELMRDDGTWVSDYVRLRMRCIRR